MNSVAVDLSKRLCFPETTRGKRGLFGATDWHWVNKFSTTCQPNFPEVRTSEGGIAAGDHRAVGIALPAGGGNRPGNRDIDTPAGKVIGAKTGLRQGHPGGGDRHHRLAVRGV